MYIPLIPIPKEDILHHWRFCWLVIWQKVCWPNFSIQRKIARIHLLCQENVNSLALTPARCIAPLPVHAPPPPPFSFSLPLPLPLFLLLLHSQLSLSSSTLWVRFLCVWPVFNPTVEVVTFHICGWCVLGVFLLRAFIHLEHESQDLLNVCDAMHVCTD